MHLHNLAKREHSLIIKYFKKYRLEIIFLIFITAFFSLKGGLPFYHPDFIVDNIKHLLENGGDPNFFNYPGLVLYVHAFFYIISDTIINLFNLIIPQAELTVNYYKLSHLVTTLFSISGVLLVYFSTYLIFKKRITAFISSLVLSTSLIWVAHSHFITVDLPLAVLCLLTVFFSLYFIKKTKVLTPLQLFILGGTVGLSAAAKYNGGLIIIAVLLPLFYNYRKRKKLLFTHTLLIIFFSLIVFTLANPFILLNFAKFENDFSYEMEHAQTGHFGYQSDNSFLYHIQNSLINGFGLLILIPALIGFLGIIFSSRITVTQKLVLIPFPLLFYLFMGNSRLAFQRYILPLIPFLAIYTACGFNIIHIKLKHSLTKKYLPDLIILILLIIVMYPGVKYSLQHNRLLAGTDTREELIKIFNIEDIPRPAFYKVFAGMYMEPTLNDTEFDQYISNYIYDLPRDINNSYLQISQTIIIFDNFSWDRLLYDPENHHLKKNYSLEKDLPVIQLSPYTTKKDKVPFAPGSTYSPYLPDPKYRKKAGPFIEIYLPDNELLDKLINNLEKYDIEYNLIRGKESYYLNQISAQ
ncbi:MAG: ArnT family glycosyltransferase [Halanaerobiales bacterium]